MANLPIRIGLCMRRALDCAALAALIERSDGLALVAAAKDPNQFLDVCRRSVPDVAMLDVTYRNGIAFSAAASLVRSTAVRGVALLDDDFVLARAVQARDLPNCCYCVKDVELNEIIDAVQRTIADEADGVKGRNRSANGSPSTDELSDKDPHRVLELTNRERQVMVHLAAGLTVNQTAEAFGLAVSTIDNHKSRIMRKLNVHRTADLVRIAITSGFVDCAAENWGKRRKALRLSSRPTHLARAKRSHER